MSWPKTKPTHGHARRGTKLTPTYRSWQAMMTRCYNPKSKSYKDYGGRGIIASEGWHYFENFLAYMGERPVGTTIERNDTNGNYTAANCRWATRAEQSSNTRSNQWVEFGGKRITQAEFSREIGMKQSTVSYRLRNGWTPEQVAAIKPHNGNRVASKLGDEVDVPEKLL